MSSQPAVAQLSVFVLAGGRSSRMGSDKALLPLQGQTLLQRALRTAVSAGERVTIVGSQQLYGAFAETIEDIYPDCGPLGGIHAALNATRTDLNLILSVDMPAMTADFLQWLSGRAANCRELAVVPYAAGGPQPLCAIYHQSLRPLAEEALKSGDYKIGNMLTLAPTCFINEEEICAAGFSPGIFRNVNTREEYEALMAADASHTKTSSPEKNT